MLESPENMHRKFVNKMKCHIKLDEEVGPICMSWDPFTLFLPL